MLERRESTAASGMLWDPDLRNIAPHPSDLVAQPDGSRPVSFQRNARKGVRKRVETSRCCGKLWAPGRKGQGERSASSPTERGPFKRNCLPGSLGSDLGENSAPRAVRTAPTPGSALREHRTAPERMRSRGLFRRRFLFQHPGPRPPGFQAGPEAKRILSKNQGRPRRAANRHPQFPQYNYQTLVPENEAAGTAVLRVVAQDPDPGEAGRLVYSLAALMNSRSLELFSIDPQSGLIRTAAALDRESMERHYLRVTAQDHGSPRLSATTMVAVTVADRNDHAPVFEQAHYRETLRENVEEGYPILQLRATDGDAPPNANLRYRFAEREYVLRIRAQDAGRPPLSNNTGLASIQVVDINDHAPIFVSTPFQVSVLENAPLGHSVIHIQAVDADHGENSRLEYSLTGVAPDTPFVINSATGWVSVSGPLDRESVEHYFFGVEARDHGSPPLSASASVTVTVLDVNDNRPEFTMKEYHLRLNEDAAVGTSVVSVTAVDRDANSAISYQITGGNSRNRFAISTQGGVGLVTLALPLDYKQERYFKLVLTASDRALHDHCYVHINITDANTHRPVFQSAHYSVSMNEDRPVGSTVVVISASDDDVGENARITYLLEDNLPQFRIDANSGAITLQAPLDYEDQVTYTLAITARDNGIPQKADTTYVEVMVNDVNDNAPQFVASHYTGLVSEDAPPFTSVLQISATDRDAHANGRVQYTFQNGEDGDGDFTIEPTSGIVRTVRRLDREAVPVYELTAYAVDRGVPPLRTPVSIQVTVQDVNDNAPVFPAEEFEVRVKENSIVGSVVAQITAVDPDEGPNAHIMYQIVEGNIPELFQMDIFSGELTALIDLDYEARQEYVIVVQATSAPLVSRATVHVRLVDQNDNSPVLNNFQILFNNYVSNRSDTFPSGIIGRIPAYDPDVSDHLFYSFERGNELQLLVVNQTSGELRLSRKLDNNRPLVASMLVTVTDGLHSVTAQCVLRVVIITEELLANSLTVRLENMWQERFLSPLLGHFLEGVAAVLATPTEDVFIFNIQNDTDLQEQLYVRRAALAARSLLDVLPFDDNVCLREPCENYMKCVSVLRFDSSAPFLASASTLFRPIQPIAGLRCRCPPGFTGDFCETELDLCYSNPCRNGGACARREGGYTCVCRPRFTGEDCELDTEAGRCVPGVCRNGGTCTNAPNGGFRCQCPAGGAFEGPRCEVAARSFPPSSFVMFRGLRQRFHLTLSLSSLDLTGPLLLGGVPNLPENFPVSHKDFIGCMRDLHIDGRRMDMAAFVANNGTMAGCQAKLHFCASGPCKNSGFCSERWGGFSCDCPVGFGGKDCRLTMAHPYHFHGNGTLTWDFGNDMTVSVPWYLGLAFRTRATKGVLMQVQLGPHSVLLLQDTVAVGGELQGLKVKQLHVGGLPPTSKEEGPQGLVGCIQGVWIGYTPFGSSALPPPSHRVNVEPGCVVTNACASGPCPPHAHCKDLWQTFSCTCWPVALSSVQAFLPVRLLRKAYRITEQPLPSLSWQLDGLELNKTTLDTVEAKKLAQRLREVTGQTDHYFSQDVRVTARLLAYLLAFESHQQGFGLTATQDAHFNENLLWAGSALLAPETGDLWAALGQRAPGGSPGSAGLVQHLEEYAATLARNMELTYLNPVGLVTPNIMLSIDRMEHPSSSQGARRYPRYHSNLFRGQDAWDPHTHVLLPSQSPQPSPSEVLPTSTNTENATASSVVSSPAPLEPEPEPGMSIVILLVYRTLGGLLPAQFQAERRGARPWPAMASGLKTGRGGQSVFGQQCPRPDGYLLRLPQNPVMNSPVVSVAVFHGRNFLRGVLVSPINLEFRLLQTANRSKAICVQWDPPGPSLSLPPHHKSLPEMGHILDGKRLEGDLELLAVFTHVAVAVSVTALVLTAAVLLSLRSLKSNVRGIHANVAAALGVAELVFLLGIHRTHNQLLCTAVAILLHYFFLSTFAWLLVQGLHLYRMQVEPRNVDRGAMRFYHALGWGVPAVLLGLAVGLDPDGYGNPDFCWISIHEPLIWSFAGPIILVIVGLAVLLLFCVLNTDARAAWTPACLSKKAAPEETRPAPGTGSGAYNNTALFEESGLIRITLGASTVSSVSSARSGRAQDQDSQRGRSYLRISNSRERLDQVPSRHPSREALGPAPQLLRAREDPASGPTHGPSTEQLDILSSILASFNSSALSSVQSSSTPSGPHTTATPSATASALGPSTPRSATSHSISELSPDSE
ncbi:cadherin EGF LAG seven-pass G-type receptor [Cricetulus griseus]|uniref:Cadherin EGF LAG seven-pass G-type receptor n=1 Tax=Cricetulus griseus TaxID=10029 RepID=A0A061I201_CRIGR|nr:cadherin EGF LAG seven-pass G-type receptor [Cricetulus griseus]